MNNNSRNTSGLERYRKEQAEAREYRVKRALSKKTMNKEKITFTGIAKEANVSKKFLYEHYYDQICTLREHQSGNHISGIRENKRTESSKDVLLMAKNKRIKELEKEVKYLKELLARRYGQDYTNM